MGRIFLVLGLAFVSNSFGVDAFRALVLGDSLYEARDQGSRYRGILEQAERERMVQAAHWYSVAMQAPELEREAGAKLLRSLYFQGCFADSTSKQRLETFNRAKELGEALLLKYPSHPDVGYWWAVALALWARETNPMRAIRAGVPGRMKLIAEKIQGKPGKISPRGGSEQILGRLHHLLPSIPVLLTWPNNASANEFLYKAVALDPEDPNPLWFLAEFLHQHNRIEEIREQVLNALARPPRPNFRLEDERALRKLRKIAKFSIEN